MIQLLLLGFNTFSLAYRAIDKKTKHLNPLVSSVHQEITHT